MTICFYIFSVVTIVDYVIIISVPFPKITTLIIWKPFCRAFIKSIYRRSVHRNIVGSNFKPKTEK